LLVGTPAQKDRCVTEPVALQVVVLHFADALDAQRFPRKILAAAPAALRTGHPLRALVSLRPVSPRMAGHRVAAKRFELGGKLAAHRHRECGGDADMVKNAGAVVEPEQKRSDQALALLVPAKASHDAIGGSHV